MEVDLPASALILEIRDASHVGDARRRATALARAHALSDTLCGNVGIVATELTNNLARHAREGLFVAQWIATPQGDALEMLSIDRGPGMSDVGRCLQDGYTTAGTPGTGLGAIKRLSGEFDIYSVPVQGTVIVSRVFAQALPAAGIRPPLQWAALSRPAPGEAVCGDVWRVAYRPGDASFMVADGLGHGPSAALAATAVADAFERHRFAAPLQFLQAAHRDIIHTRGAAVAVARMGTETGRLTFAGVGNISASTLRDGVSKGLFSHNGTVGAQVRKIQEFEYAAPMNGLLIMHSDGIQTRWSLDAYPGVQSRHPAIVAGVLARDFQRGRDDLTVLVAKLGE